MLRSLHTPFLVIRATFVSVSLLLCAPSLAQTTAELAAQTATTPPEAQAVPASEEQPASELNASQEPKSGTEPEKETEMEKAVEEETSQPQSTPIKRIGSVPNMSEPDVDYVGLLEESLLIDPKSIPKKLPFWDEEDHELILKDFKGKLVLLNFWATWCTPCALEMPELNALQEEFDDAELPIKIVALSEDFKGAEVVKQFYKDNEIEFLDVYIDKKNALFREMGIISLPTTIIIDQEGQEILRISGYINWNAPDVKEFIRGFVWDD